MPSQLLKMVEEFREADDPDEPPMDFATLRFTLRFLSVSAVIMGLCCLFLIGAIVGLHNEIQDVKNVTLANREQGYKNRAVVCEIHRQLIAKPKPLPQCLDPNVQKYTK